MTEPLGTDEQQELVREAGGVLLSAAPEGWQELRLSFRSTVGIDTATFLCTDDSGEQVRLAPPTSALRMLKKLRYGMYVEGRGAWFTATLTIRPPGRHGIDFDYEAEPSFTPALKSKAYALDFEYFPRSDENTPDWLKQRLAEVKGGGSTE